MKSLERCVSLGRSAALGLGALAALGLGGCAIPPIRATEEVIRTVANMAGLPLPPFFSNYEPSLNECVETRVIKVCKSYLSKENASGLTEGFYTILKLDKRIPQTLLVLGYFDGNNYDLFDEDKKLLVVVAYGGESSKDLIDPYYGNMGLDYAKFMEFFERPRESTFDESENQFKNAMERGFIDDIKFAVLRGKLKEIMQGGLELFDEKLPQFAK